MTQASWGRSWTRANRRGMTLAPSPVSKRPSVFVANQEGQQKRVKMDDLAKHSLTHHTKAPGSPQLSSQPAPHWGITGTGSPYKRGQVEEQVMAERVHST